MFKKAFKVSSKNNLSGKDKKKLVSDLSKYYDSESVSMLLEKNNPSVVVNKVQGSKIVLYLIDDIPVIVDASGKGDLFPSIYTIQQYPNFAKFVEIKLGVESFILGGANLMWPGVKNLKEIGPFQKDDVRYIKTSDNQVVAVGLMACSLAELVANGPTGNAVFVLHVMDDKLWAMGPKKILSPVMMELKPQESGKDTEFIHEKVNEETKEEGGQLEKKENDQDIEEIKVDRDNESEEDKEDKEETKEGEEVVPQKVMDEYLMEAFLTSLKISLSDKDLPMDGGEFYSNHLLPCKREGVFIDLKNTSYKKISKFLQAMSKLGIIDFKETKKGGVPQITRVNRQNKRLLEFDPVVTQAAKKEVKEEEISEDDKWPKVEVQELYKLKTPMFQFFPADTYIKGKDNLFTHEQVRNAMQNYIKERNLNEKKNVELDENMKPLFWEEKPDLTGPKYVITKEELFKKIDNYLIPYHKIIDLQTKEEEIRAGNLKGITLIAEKKS